MYSEKLITREFFQHGVVTVAHLASKLNMSQPTLSRRLAGMKKQLLRTGKGKATQYGLKREVGSMGSSWPLFEIQENGDHLIVGYLTALHARKWHFETDWFSLKGRDFSDGIFPGLPWFLDDLRPQGFLGRAFAKTHGSQMNLDTDPTRWSSDAVFESLLRFGSHFPSSFVLGEESLQAALNTSAISVVRYGQRKKQYPLLANIAMSGAVPGSSAGGEQPKFTALLEQKNGSQQHVIVKFSGNQARPEDERWSDLLAAEYLALGILSKAGLTTGKANLLDADGRRFLTVERFDRIDTYGRRAVVSLFALDSAFFGAAHTPWIDAADRLEKEEWILPEDAEKMRVLWHFGSLIGNNDMHYGNISFLIKKERPLQLAPSYDMLPMALRPNVHGSLPTVISKNRNLPPPPLAIELAQSFWKKLSTSTHISENFRKIVLSIQKAT